MKLDKPFKDHSFSELKYLLANRERYTRFNSLGFFRAILEKESLSVEERIALRGLACEAFGKQYEFLQVKDPVTYHGLDILGLDLTEGDLRQRWHDIKLNQEAILKSKRIKHRSFGTYSKHLCGYDGCPYHGVMFPQGHWWLRFGAELKLPSDHARWPEGKARSMKKAQREFKNSWRKVVEE